MKVQGRTKEIYKIIMENGNSSVEGIIYNIEQKESKKALILNESYCTKEKEMQLVNALSGLVVISPKPIDILYQKGKFIGYVFLEGVKKDTEEKKREEIKPEPIPIDNKKEKNEIDFSSLYPQREIAVTNENTNGFLYTDLARFLFGILACVILSGVNFGYFWNRYQNFAVTKLPSDVGIACLQWSFSGWIGFIGILLVISACFLLRSKINLNNGSAIIYLVVNIFAGFLGMLIIYALLTGIIYLVMFLIAIVPTLIVIGVIIYIVKRTLKR